MITKKQLLKRIQSLEHDQRVEDSYETVGSQWVVVTDWHLFEQFGRGGNQRARDSYNLIGKHVPSLGIHCGDMICQHADSEMIDYEQLREIEAMAGCPWLHCVGNHEVNLTASDPAVVANRVKLFYAGVRDFYTSNTHEFGQKPYNPPSDTTAARLAYNNETGSSNYKAPPFDIPLYPQINHQGGWPDVWAKALPEEDLPGSLGYYAMRHLPTGVTHIILNTGSTGGLDTAQKEWLEDEVLARMTSEDRIALYAHHWLLANLDLRAMLTACPAKTLAIFSGHYHGNHIDTSTGFNFIRLPSSGHASKPYTDPAAVRPNAFAMCRWNENKSQLIIDGYNGTDNYRLTIP